MQLTLIFYGKYIRDCLFYKLKACKISMYYLKFLLHVVIIYLIMIVVQHKLHYNIVVISSLPFYLINIYFKVRVNQDLYFRFL